MARLTVATCQFPVSADPRHNGRHVRRLMRVAEERGAHVAHFPEACLSGYAGADLESYAGYDWGLLARETERVVALAAELGLWVVVGSAHRLTGRRKPHNSVYVVDDRGAIVDRYDKMFCAGDRAGKQGDLAHYTPGDHFSTFVIRGVRCGAMICHEYRYPELYREYKRRGVELMFHAYHAGHIAPARLRDMEAQVGRAFHQLNGGTTLPAITMPAAMHAAAADNYMFISASNTSARVSCWAAFFVRPDGVITGRLRRHAAGVLVSQVDTRTKFYDSTEPWRSRAMEGVYHSGKLVRDARSAERTRL
jgi:deaminated glutathione amidase